MDPPGGLQGNLLAQPGRRRRNPIAVAVSFLLRHGPESRNGFFCLVELQVAAVLFLFGRVGFELDRLGLPLDGRGEVTDLGVSGRQGFDAVGLLPARQLAGLDRDFDGPTAVAIRVVGAGGPDPGLTVQGAGVAGVQAEGALKVGEGLGEIVLFAPGPAAAAIGVGVLGIAADRLGEVGDGVVELLGGLPGEGPVAVPNRVPRFEADRVAVVGDGLVELFLLAPDQSALVVGSGAFGLELDGGIEVGDGLVELSLVISSRRRGPRRRRASRGLSLIAVSRSAMA